MGADGGVFLPAFSSVGYAIAPTTATAAARVDVTAAYASRQGASRSRRAAKQVGSAGRRFSPIVARRGRHVQALVHDDPGVPQQLQRGCRCRGRSGSEKLPRPESV